MFWALPCPEHKTDSYMFLDFSETWEKESLLAWCMKTAPSHPLSRGALLRLLLLQISYVLIPETQHCLRLLRLTDHIAADIFTDTVSECREELASGSRVQQPITLLNRCHSTCGRGHNAEKENLILLITIFSLHFGSSYYFRGTS